MISSSTSWRPKLDRWQDADGTGWPPLEGIVVDEVVLIGAHDLDQVVFGDGVAGFAAQDLRAAIQRRRLLCK